MALIRIDGGISLDTVKSGLKTLDITSKQVFHRGTFEVGASYRINYTIGSSEIGSMTQMKASLGNGSVSNGTDFAILYGTPGDLTSIANFLVTGIELKETIIPAIALNNDQHFEILINEITGSPEDLAVELIASIKKAFTDA